MAMKIQSKWNWFFGQVWSELFCNFGNKTQRGFSINNSQERSAFPLEHWSCAIAEGYFSLWPLQQIHGEHLCSQLTELALALSAYIWSTLDRSFTNVPRGCLLWHPSIKLLIIATLLASPTLLLKHFPFLTMLLSIWCKYSIFI